LSRSAQLKGFLERRLSEREEILHASANTVTGTLLVISNGGLGRQDITGIIGELLRHYASENGESVDSGAAESSRKGKTADPLRLASDGSAKPSAIRQKVEAFVLGGFQKQPQKPWHHMEAGQVLAALDTSGETGLSEKSARENLKRYGPNLLPESARRSALSIFLGQLNSLPVALLGVAASVSVLTGGLADALVILGVVGINAVIGYATESQAEKTIESLKDLVRPGAQAIRDGVCRDVALEEIVPGDLVALRPGSYVPADSRLVEAVHLTVDESALTGESMPVRKVSGVLAGTNVPLADRVNMVHMGTLVTGGHGTAVAAATGKHTEIGRVHGLVENASAPETPMERQLSRMSNQLVFISGGVCALIFFIGLLRNYGFLQMLKMSISLAVAAVPEGLPTVATTTLAIGVNTMRGKKVVMRHLEAVETLGAVQTICFDKTGTVTENRMAVRKVFTGMRAVAVGACNGSGEFVCESRAVDPLACEELLQLLRVSVLCSETVVAQDGSEYVLHGSSTEAALVRMALRAGIDPILLREDYLLLKTNHRSEDRHFMGTLHRRPNGGTLFALKGSPPEVLTMCQWQIRDGERVPLTEDERTVIEIENEEMAGDALRVLGFAFSVGDDGEVFDSQDALTWLGLVGMADPIRKGVRELMPLFHNAGIETILITGDQSATAHAIGKELDLSRGAPLEILDSTHLADLEPDALRALSQRVHVFSRVSPAHKLQIVQALQRSGRVVAMTGDGINDGPALKAADIGVALGGSGTDIAREVADVVLEDDNLETMIAAVSYGRTVHANIRKTLHFLLATNFSEIMVMFAGTATGLGSPLTAMQLLWINLLSDIFPGLALALEQPEPGVMDRPPRDPHEPVVRAGDFKRLTFESGVMTAGALAAYGYGALRHGLGPAAGTLAFQSLTLTQLLHAVSCRSEQHTIFDRERLPRNKYLDLALGGSLVLQMLTFFVPGLRTLLGLTPVGLVDGLVIGASALLPLLINESTKPIERSECHEEGLYVHVGIGD